MAPIGILQATILENIHNLPLLLDPGMPRKRAVSFGVADRSHFYIATEIENTGSNLLSMKLKSDFSVGIA
jgi:hypothetical protein